MGITRQIHIAAHEMLWFFSGTERMRWPVAVKNAFEHGGRSDEDRRLAKADPGNAGCSAGSHQSKGEGCLTSKKSRFAISTNSASEIVIVLKSSHLSLAALRSTFADGQSDGLQAVPDNDRTRAVRVNGPGRAVAVLRHPLLCPQFV